MAKVNGIRACFFDQVSGKKIDKIFIKKNDKCDEIYITFQENDVIKIEVSLINSMTWKDDADNKHLLKIEV